MVMVVSKKYIVLIDKLMCYFHPEVIYQIEYDFITNNYIIEIYGISSTPYFDPFDFYPKYKIINNNIFLNVCDIYETFHYYSPIISKFILIKFYEEQKINLKSEPFKIYDFNTYPYLIN